MKKIGQTLWGSKSNFFPTYLICEIDDWGCPIRNLDLINFSILMKWWPGEILANNIWSFGSGTILPLAKLMPRPLTLRVTTPDLRATTPDHWPAETRPRIPAHLNRIFFLVTWIWVLIDLSTNRLINFERKCHRVVQKKIWETFHFEDGPDFEVDLLTYLILRIEDAAFKKSN